MSGERTAVDATLIREMMCMTPIERLRQNDRAIAQIKELRDAFAAKRANKPTEETRRKQG